MTMPDYTVRDYGPDTSGRRIFLTVYMHDWWEAVVSELGFRPTIIQGAFMTRNGGGAHDSSGFHDEAGCMDVRTRDLTTAQVDALIRVTRRRGGGSWRRDWTDRHGGMDPHCHITLGSDSPLSPGAWVSWGSYKSGGDGLAGPGSDYEWRPSPLVLIPPEDDMPSPKDWTPEDWAAVKEKLSKPLIADLLAAVVDGGKGTLKEAARRILKAFDRNGDPK